MMFSSSAIDKQLCANAKNISISGGYALYKVSQEEWIKDITDTPSPSVKMNYGDQYVAFKFRITNSGTTDVALNELIAVIDGNLRVSWILSPLKAGASCICHIYRVNMEKLQPGLHCVEFYGNGCLLDTVMLSLSRDWSKQMNLSALTEQAIVEHNQGARERAPYAGGYYGLESQEYDAFAVDFKADFLPQNTYLCPIGWQFDTTFIKDKVKSVPKGRDGYCGLQVHENRTAAIMSVWDTPYVDKDDNSGLVHATISYYKPGTEYLVLGDKTGLKEQGNYSSTFTQCLLSYEWKKHNWYRALIELGTSKTTGNRMVSYWICDLANNTWELLMVFDLGIKETSMNGFYYFLENYNPRVSGQIRTMELTNMRARKKFSDTWVSVDTIKAAVNQIAIKELAHQGSYSYACDGHTLSVITSGVGGLCKEQPAQTYKILSTGSGRPY